MIILFFVLLNISFSQEKEYKIEEEVLVTGQRTQFSIENSAMSIEVIDSKEIEKMAIHSISDILELSAGIDVRNRGKSGSQADISIRGGSFNQTLIMIDGIPVNDPQTGHHNMNLTIPPELIDRIEIVKSGSSKSSGINSFSGTINIITKRQLNNKFITDLSGGEFGYYNIGLIFQDKRKEVLDYKNIEINEIIFFNIENSNGFTNNTDFENINFGSLVTTKFSNDIVSNFDLTFSSREFGANSFYTTRFPNQFEVTRTLNMAWKGEFGNKLKFKPNLYYRTNFDRFELFRDYLDAPDFDYIHNYHISGVRGASGNLSYDSKFGVTSLGYEITREKITSNVLGEDREYVEKYNGPEKMLIELFITGELTKSKTRFNYTSFLENSFKNDNIVLNTGLSVFHNSDFGTYFNPGLDFAFKVNSRNKVLVNINRSVRIPTFTELYYNDAIRKNNLDLKPETSNNYEIGYSYLNRNVKINSGVFARQGENMIDWNKHPDSTKWQSNNINNINFFGIESDVMLYLNLENKYINVKTLKFGGLFMQSNMKESGFDSYYVLDHLNYKFNLLLNINIFNSIEITYDMSYQKRNGSFQLMNGDNQIMSEYDAFLMSNIKLNYNLKKLTSHNLDLYLDITNLFDQDYFDIANVPVAGRWTTMGINYNLGY